MATTHDATVANDTGAATLPDGVRGIEAITPTQFPGCAVFVHFNGPTDQLRAVSTGMVVLDPGARPHDPHRHPEEEFLIATRRRRSARAPSCTAPGTPCTASRTPARGR